MTHAHAGGLGGPALTLALVAACLGATWRASFFPGARPAPPLERPQVVADLDAVLDGSPGVGLCFLGSPVLEGVPRRACQPADCLWSPRERVNIDLAVAPLTPLPNQTAACPRPAGAQVELPPGGRPAISFIIPMYNGAEMTAQCVLELFRTAKEADGGVEVVVVDDGSTDDVAPLVAQLHLLSRYFGMRHVLLRNRVPSGFGAACNQGVEASSGTHIVFINNDLLVARGWLAAMLHALAAHGAGAVGPLIVGEGSVVQEAGGIVWADGGAEIAGRHSLMVPFLNQVRAVDYASAACLLMRRDAFDQVGGFDRRYGRGYYEDTDLAMALSAAGLPVMLQPLAVVHHREGGTFGTDETSAPKRVLMERNGRLFAAKWADRLQKLHCPRSEGQLQAIRRHAQPHVLWIDDTLPEPDRDSGSQRSMAILRALCSAGYGVTMLPFVRRDLQYKAAVRAMGVTVLPSKPVEGWVFDDGGACMYDVFFIARRAVFAMAVDRVKDLCPGVPIIYDTVDLHFLRESRDAVSTSAAGWQFGELEPMQVMEWLDQARGTAAAALRRQRDLELAFMDAAKVTIVVSQAEVDVIQRYRPRARPVLLSNIYDVPGGVEQAALTEEDCAGRSGVLFVGNMNHVPNTQAIAALVEDVLPLVLAALPARLRADFRVHVVGSNDVPPWLLSLMATAPHVKFHGALSDQQLEALYSTVGAAVAPLLSGAGVKGKVAHAFLRGVPIVATPIAVEGMHAAHGVACLVGRTPQEFANGIVRALTDCPLAAALVRGGHRVLSEKFSYPAAQARVLEIFAAAGWPARPLPQRAACRPKRKTKNTKMK